MNARRARARRAGRSPLAPDVRIRVEELKLERREALSLLLADMQPARDALLAKRRETAEAIDRHDAVYRARRSELQREFAARVDAVRRAAASGLVVTVEVPS